MNLPADDLSFGSKKQSKSVCSKIAVPSVVVLLEIRNTTNPKFRLDDISEGTISTKLIK